MNRDSDFDDLCKKVKYCTRCERMEGSARVLSRAAGPLSAKAMFIGEAPGRLGADESEIPLHGDQAGHNFEDLLDFSRIRRAEIFVTNAALCNPKDAKGNNASPKKNELENCSGYLREQIEIVNPAIVVTLGAAALDALRMVEKHDLVLSEHVRTINRWFGRKLIPLYHPGTRAMIHRSKANQRSDYQFVSEQISRLEIRRGSGKAPTPKETLPLVASVVAEILSRTGAISYFALHKLLYLAEYRAVVDTGSRLSNAYFLRQKDGPYCADIQIRRLAKAIPDLRIRKWGDKLVLELKQNGFFDDDARSPITEQAARILDSVVQDASGLSDSELKTKAYMTRPMRKMLRQEKVLLRNMYNAPIEFAE